MDGANRNNVLLVSNQIVNTVHLHSRAEPKYNPLVEGSRYGHDSKPPHECRSSCDTKHGCDTKPGCEFNSKSCPVTDNVKIETGTPLSGTPLSDCKKEKLRTKLRQAGQKLGFVIDEQRIASFLDQYYDLIEYSGLDWDKFFTGFLQGVDIGSQIFTPLCSQETSSTNSEKREKVCEKEVCDKKDDSGENKYKVVDKILDEMIDVIGTKVDTEFKKIADELDKNIKSADGKTFKDLWTSLGLDDTKSKSGTDDKDRCDQNP